MKPSEPPWNSFRVRKLSVNSSCEPGRQVAADRRARAEDVDRIVQPGELIAAEDIDRAAAVVVPIAAAPGVERRSEQFFDEHKDAARGEAGVSKPGRRLPGPAWH